MAGVAGLYSQIGMVAETTYGTAVTVTRFLEFESESLKLDVQRIESPALRSGQTTLRYDRWAANKKGAAGDVSWVVANKGFGLLFAYMFGSSAISTHSGGTNAKDHVYVLADQYPNKSMTVQVGRPSLSGTVQPFTYTGCKITDWELSNDVDGLLMLKTTFDAKNETTATALASASYVSAQEEFNFTQAALTFQGTAVPVHNVSITGSNAMKTDRYFLAGSSLKSEPVRNAKYEIGVTTEADFTDLALYTFYTGGGTASLTATWTSASLIEGSTPYSLTVSMPCVRTDGETPNVAGADLLTQPMTFKVLDNGSAAPITVTYVTSDTAD